MNSPIRNFFLLLSCLAILAFPSGCVQEVTTQLGNITRPKSNKETIANSTMQAHMRPIPGVEKDRPRFALVIGNSDYRNVPTLSNPRHDAFDMKKVLAQLNFQVDYLENAPNRRAMIEAVRKFGNVLSHNRDAVGLFYYAGHAVQIEGINYLIPVNAVIKSKVDAEFETLNINYLLQTLDQAENSMSVVILDACRDNPFARGFRGFVDRGLAPMDSPTGSLIVFATAPGKTAEDGAGRNGTFTRYLLQFIDTPGLTIEQMLKRVRASVMQETEGNQTPWETSSLRGDFCFAGCRDPEEIKRKAMQEAMEKLKGEMKAEQQRLEKERAALEAERSQIEKKKVDIQKQAHAAKQAKDTETLESIRKEQEALVEQKRLLEEERARIEEQKVVLTNQQTSAPQKEEEIRRLKEEQKKIEKERAELERLRKEAEKVRKKKERERDKRIMPAVAF